MNRHQPVAGPSKDANALPSLLQLSPEVLSRFKPVKLFKDSIQQGHAEELGVPGPLSITSIAFDDTGEKCVTAGEDEAFVLWDVKKGRQQKRFYSRKYGIDLARFSHREQNIVHASTKLDDHTVRYHSMHDNKYLSYFRGHTDRVRSIDMCPIDDTFLTAGDDGTVRLWDLRSTECKGLLNDIGGSAIAAFDNTGKVFGVACSESQTIMLYDVGSFDSIPFIYGPLIDQSLTKISMPPPRPVFTSISFSSNGEYILIGTSLGIHYVVDAFDLSVIRRLDGCRSLGEGRHSEVGRGRSGEDVSWSADSRWVVGAGEGKLCMWDLNPLPGQDKLLPVEDATAGGPMTLQPAVALPMGPALGTPSPRAVRFNPRYAMLAMGGASLSMWLPVKDDDTLIQEGY